MHNSQLIGNGPTCEFPGVLTLILWRPRQLLDETLMAATPNPSGHACFTMARSDPATSHPLWAALHMHTRNLAS